MMELVRREAPPEAWGVVIDDEAVVRFAQRFEPLDLSFDYSGLPRDLGTAEWWDFVVLSVSCIACLWPPDGDEMWSTLYRGERLDDAPGFFSAFTKALERGELSFTRIAEWRMKDVERLFDGAGTLQLLPERLERLRAVAAIAIDRWEGTFEHLVEEAAFDGPAIARLLVETVPGYRDEAETEFGILRFWKLAHLATVMMSGAGPTFSGLDGFPIYPDYMVPRTLRHHGVLRYSDALAAAVDGRALIEAGSEWELAIRWASMHAAEQVLDALDSAGRTVAMPQLDYWLWHAAVLGPEADQMGEHHRTVTMHY